MASAAYATAKPTFVLKHLTKAGGTFFKILIRQVLDRQFWKIVGDDAPMHALTAQYSLERVQKSEFVAVTMRNPCDVYLSFCAFHAIKSFGYGETALDYPFEQAYAPKPLTAPLLKEWMLCSRRKGSLVGYYTW